MIFGIGVVRFSLAAMVMLFHVFHVLAVKTCSDTGACTFLGFTHLGVGILGVCLFFFLSGFLVSHMSCKYRYWTFPKLFVLNRTLRIYPTYLFVLVISIAVFEFTRTYLMQSLLGIDKIPVILGANWLSELLGWGINFWNKAWADIFVFARNTMSLESRGDWNPVLWTIDVELRAYAVIGLLLFLTKNYLARSVAGKTSSRGEIIGKGWRQIIIISLLAVMLAMAVDAVAFFLNPINIGAAWINSNIDSLWIMHQKGASLLFFSPMFLSGGLLALARQKVIDPQRGRIASWFFAIISIGCYYYWLMVQGNVPDHFRIAALLLYVILLTGIFFLIEYGLGGWANNKTLRFCDGFLGDMSYPLYLVNFPIAVYLSKSMTTPRTTIYIAGSVTIAVIMAILAVLAVEKPLKSIRRRLTETAISPDTGRWIGRIKLRACDQ